MTVMIKWKAHNGTTMLGGGLFSVLQIWVYHVSFETLGVLKYYIMAHSLYLIDKMTW